MVMEKMAIDQPKPDSKETSPKVELPNGADNKRYVVD